jgi:hypothetical protein
LKLPENIFSSGVLIKNSIFSSLHRLQKLYSGCKTLFLQKILNTALFFPLFSGCYWLKKHF